MSSQKYEFSKLQITNFCKIYLVFRVFNSSVFLFSETITKEMRAWTDVSAPPQVDVFVYQPGPGEALLSTVQRAPILSTHLPTNQNTAFQTPFISNVTRVSAGWYPSEFSFLTANNNIRLFLLKKIMVVFVSGAPQFHPGEHQQFLRS